MFIRMALVCLLVCGGVFAPFELPTNTGTLVALSYNFALAQEVTVPDASVQPAPEQTAPAAPQVTEPAQVQPAAPAPRPRPVRRRFPFPLTPRPAAQQPVPSAPEVPAPASQAAVPETAPAAGNGASAPAAPQAAPEVPVEPEIHPPSEVTAPAPQPDSAAPEVPPAVPSARPAGGMLNYRDSSGNYFPPAGVTTQAAPHAPTDIRPAAPAVPSAPQATPAPPFGQPRPRVAAQPQARGAARRGDVSFNFDDADIYSVIQTVFGDILRANYIIDPAVKGRVTFRSVEPVTRESVLPLLEVILRLNGIGIVEEGGLYRIIPISDISREPAAVGIGRESDKVSITGKALVQVVSVKYVPSSEMVRILTPFLSKTAVIIDVPKSNYIVVVDTDANVKRLLQIVEIFDSEQLKQVTPQIFVYAVQNSKAKDVAALLQQIFQGKGAAAPSPKTAAPAMTRPLAPGQPPLPTAAPAQPQVHSPQAGGEALVAETTRIIPDEVTNSIIVLATPDDYTLIKDTIEKIDIAPRQVVIEGLIVQVSLTDNLSFGMAYAINTDLTISPFRNDFRLTGDAQMNPGGMAVTANPSPIPAGGFSFIGRDPTGQIRAVLTALEDRSKAKVVAAPHILVADNREARIQVGQQIPLATSTSSQITSAINQQTQQTTTTSTPVIGTTTVQYKDIGIILKVKPQVNDSGLINLELSQEISSVGGTFKVGGLDEISIDKTEATTNMVARDGETIIIGGLIREDTSLGTTGFPLLSRIPIIGALFGTQSDKVQRKELIILLTPHVVRNQKEAKNVTTDYLNRYKSGAKDKQIDDFISERSGQKQGEKAAPKNEGNGAPGNP